MHSNQTTSGPTAADVLHAVLNEVEHDEQCPACNAVNEWDPNRSYCPRHAGEMSGYDRAMGEISETAVAFQRDPELVDTVMEHAQQMRIREFEVLQRAKQQQPEPEGLSEHEKQIRDAEPIDPATIRLAIDADCPGCGHPERRFDPNTAVYSCRHCPYTSGYRDH